MRWYGAAKRTPIKSQSKVVHNELTGRAFELHANQIDAELKACGATTYDIVLPETHYLHHVILPDEHIRGSVYGRYELGRGALVATDRRILFIDKKLLFSHFDEIDFTVVGGVSRTRVWFSGVVTLHTRLGDYKIRTFNQKNARNFVQYIGTRFFERSAANHYVAEKPLK